jgi:plastocyanin
MPIRSNERGGAAAVICLFVLSACSGSSGGAKPAENATVPAAAPAVASPAPGAHRVAGKAPAAVSGMPSIVVLDPKEPREFPAQADRPAMDQITQTFVPAILFVRTGQPTDFKNSDDVLHNVRVRNAETREGTFNVAIPTGQIYTHTFDRDGFYDIGCDIHPAMSAQVISTTSPYATLADPDGTFVFEDVAPGAYKVTIYSGTEREEKSIEVAEPVTTVGS